MFNEITELVFLDSLSISGLIQEYLYEEYFQNVRV